MLFVCSKTITSNPAFFAYLQETKPAIPAPITATFRFPERIITVCEVDRIESESEMFSQ